MAQKIIIWISLISFYAMAKSPEPIDSVPVSKGSDNHNPSSDLSQVSARLTVEGAKFRDFNLFFAPIHIEDKASPEQKKLAHEVRAIIERDLKIVGGFNLVTDAKASLNEQLLKKKGMEGVSRLLFAFGPNKIKASLEHHNLINGKKSLKGFGSNQEGLRKLSHLLAQSIYQEFIGPEDLFLLQIAAIKRGKSHNQVVLMDFDGHSEVPLNDNKWTKASPYFSPDGKSILYSVISKESQGIVEQKVGSKQFQFRTKKPGINLDPRIMPDNSAMLVTLSHEGSTNIYRASRSGVILGRLTSGFGMNLSPSISPDGKEMVFVSDRSGNPQIYLQPLLKARDKPHAKRLTFQGKYNQTPHFSPDGKLIAFTGRDEKNKFDIFLLERSSGRTTRVTQDQGRNQEPFFSPSGRFVIFTSERDGKTKPDIFVATLNGSHQYRLTDANDGSNGLGYTTPLVRPRQ